MNDLPHGRAGDRPVSVEPNGQAPAPSEAAADAASLAVRDGRRLPGDWCLRLVLVNGLDVAGTYLVAESSPEAVALDSGEDGAERRIYVARQAVTFAEAVPKGAAAGERRAPVRSWPPRLWRRMR